MDLMTTNNDMFEEAMKNYPKVKKTLQAPYHIGLGSYIDITCDGITSLRADQVGTEMSFLDINKAHRDGYFGKDPRIWGDKDWSLLIDYLGGGTEYSPAEWGNIAYRPQVWSTIEGASDAGQHP